MYYYNYAKSARYILLVICAQRYSAPACFCSALPFSLFATFSLLLRQKRRKCICSVISCGEQPRTTKMEEQNHGTHVYKGLGPKNRKG